MSEVIKEPARENKMGVMPVGRLLINMSLPLVLSVLVQATYNVVDSIFISRIVDVGESGLAAISIAYPLQNLIFAVASGTGMGINAMLSRRLGEKRFDDANRIAQNGLFLAMLSWAVFALVGIFFSRAYFVMQTDDPEIIAIGANYMRICVVFSFGMLGQITLERFLLAVGRADLSMLSLMASAVIKIILDPIMIFGYLGFPALGVTGGAVSSVTGQILGMGIALLLNLKYNKEISLFKKGFRPSRAAIGDIYKIGIPSIAMSSVGSVMTFGMNMILLSYTATATAVMGTYFRLQTFFVQPAVALNNGVVSIVAYNYGAKKRERIIKTIRLSIIMSVSILMFSLAVMQIFPVQLLRAFNASEDMLAIGTIAFRRISISYLGAGVVIILTAVFQALGRSVLSLILSLVRQLIVLLPCAYLLSRFYGLDAVWWAWPIAEISALTMSFLFFRKTYRVTIKGIPDEEETAPVPDAEPLADG